MHVDCPSGAPPSAADARRRLLVIFNPTAGGARGRRLRRTLESLRTMGCLLDLRETTKRGDAEAFAAGAHPGATDAVVVAGGDGTINEVINGLTRTTDGLCPANHLPLGIIPLGTANVLAQDMKLGTAPARVARAIVEGTPHRCALARANGRLFLLMAGAGFDAHVVENVKLAFKRRTGAFAYAWETLWQSLRYGFPTLKVTVNGTTHEAATVEILNGPLYGGPFVAVPEANLREPALHVVLLRRKGLRNVLRYAVALGLGRLHRLPDVTVLRTTAPVHINGPEGDPLQADGDIFGHLPATLEVAHCTVNLLYPPTH